MTNRPKIPVLADKQKRRAANATIKGYLYQFIESLILALDNETTRVEGIEDIDISTSTKIEAVQVKYYERTKWSLGSIRDAIIPMFNSYENNPELTFSLFIHVRKSSNQQLPKALTEDDLKECLTIHTRDKNNKWTPKQLCYDPNKPELLRGFASHFRIEEAASLDDLEKQAVTKLCTVLNCSETEARIIHLMRGVVYIQETASKKDESERIIKRDELIDFLKIKDLIYNEWHKQRIGLERFTDEIVHKLRALGYGKQSIQKTLYVSCKHNEIATLAEIAELLSRSITNPETKCLKTAQPWTIIVDSEGPDVLDCVKQSLIGKDIELNDGHENIQFNPRLFGSIPFVETKGRGPVLSRISFSLRVVAASSVRLMIEEIPTSSRQDFDFGKILSFQTVPDDLRKLFSPDRLIQIENIACSSILELLGRVIG